EWVIWFESVAHETFDGMHIEMWIVDHYHEVYLERDGYLGEDVITLEESMAFVLQINETYKIRISDKILYEYPAMRLPF
ncbi:hypothetical protein, partial [Lentibacillus kapialis]|uniref:hypothetical protein n=1 Tax=Lentibacillus kapialis TaxID=340214 RepID=UPI00166EB33B